MSNILIVDDEIGIQESLYGVLEDEGYKASSVASGEACLELLRRIRTSMSCCWISGSPESTVSNVLQKIRVLDDRA